MSEASRQTLIHEGTEVEGTVRSRCDVVIGGGLKGDLRAPALTITPAGRVQGRIEVERLVSQGEVSGEIDAGVAELSGRVADQTVIRAKRLEVRLNPSDGGVRATFGACQLRVGEKRERDDRREGQRQEEPVRFEAEPVL